MTTLICEILSKINWRLLNEQSKKILTLRYSAIIIKAKKDKDEMLEIIGRIFNCSSKVARQYSDVLTVRKITTKKLKQYVGK